MNRHNQTWLHSQLDTCSKENVSWLPLPTKGLTLAHDHRKRTVQATAKCCVNFTICKLCQMKACPDGRHFKLKRQLWGDRA